jgi:hypothetical protein
MRKDQYVWQQTAEAPPDEFKKQTICIPGSASPAFLFIFPVFVQEQSCHATGHSNIFAPLFTIQARGTDGNLGHT